MSRKTKKPAEVSIRQDVVRGDVTGQSFDIMLRFTNNAIQPELYMDELVKLVLEGLLENYGEIVVKINWWADGLQVIVPNSLPIDDFANTSVTSQEARTEAIKQK